MSMVEVTIDSIHVSLVDQSRIIMLKEHETKRYLPILIGPDMAEAINMELQNVVAPRPMTHDLMKNIVAAMNGQVSHIVVNDLKNDTFYAKIVLDVKGKVMEIDSRPSDALALAVRSKVKIFVENQVMDNAGITPEAGIDLDTGREASSLVAAGEDENLEAFEDFIDTLDLDDFEK